MKFITTDLLNRFWKNGIKPVFDKRITSYEDLMANTASGYTPDALAVKEAVSAGNSNLDKKLSFAAINSGGSLSANTAKEFSISNVGDIIFYFLNYGGKYYTLTSLLNTAGCCTNGIITINYTYNTNTKIITVTANVNCTLTGIYGLV